jgi:hypothetical protein
MARHRGCPRVRHRPIRDAGALRNERCGKSCSLRARQVKRALRSGPTGEAALALSEQHQLWLESLVRDGIITGYALEEYDRSFLNRIPANVDPCGENGEFHTFAYDGPMFKKAVSVVVGETVSRDGFIFTDLLPEAQDNLFAAVG